MVTVRKVDCGRSQSVYGVTASACKVDWVPKQPYFLCFVPSIDHAGMGDICAAWVTGRSGGPESTASLDFPDTSHPHHSAPNHPSSPLQQSLLQGTRREVAQR